MERRERACSRHRLSRGAWTGCRRTRSLVALVIAIVVTTITGGCTRPNRADRVDDLPSTDATQHTGAAGSSWPTPSVEVVAEGADFYRPPDPLPPGPAGALLRYQEIKPTVRAGTRTFRIMYLSRSVRGEPIAVTGAAVVPDSPAPPGGRLVLTIAHGTVGLADVCAPSKDLPPSRAFPPNELALIAPVPPVAQWLLVQTDYEGLGTPGRHPYLVGESEGRAVIDAARAAAQLPGADPSGRIAIAGYSQGGHAALWAGEVASRWAPELEVIGVFSGAPGADLDWSLTTTADTQDLPTRRAILLATIAGHHAAYPDTDPTTVLTELGQQRLELLDELCVAEFVAAVAEDDPRSMLRPEGIEAWAEILSQSNAGQNRIAAPVLIIYGDEDIAFPLSAREAMIDRMCGVEGNVIERRVIPGSHNSASRPAFAAGIAWLTQRAAGQDPTDECPQRRAATKAEHEG